MSVPYYGFCPGSTRECSGPPGACKCVQIIKHSRVNESPIDKALADIPKPCNQTCPKCGSGDVILRFYEGGSGVEYKKYDNINEKDRGKYLKSCGGMSTRYEFMRDCIHHHCRTCQYGWIGEPL